MVRDNFLRCEELDASIFGSLMLPGLPKTLTPLASLYVESYARPDAILASVKATGILVAWRGGVISSIDQRFAKMALDRMMSEPINPEKTKEDLAAAVKAWRAQADMTQGRAAEVLGMSKRTYEGIEAGRGFVYPQMLMLALKAFE